MVAVTGGCLSLANASGTPVYVGSERGLWGSIVYPAPMTVRAAELMACEVWECPEWEGLADSTVCSVCFGPWEVGILVVWVCPEWKGLGDCMLFAAEEQEHEWCIVVVTV
jgi:hypothetical protein